MSWKGYETFKVCTSNKEYEKWKKNQEEKKKNKLPTLEEAIEFCDNYKNNEFITTQKGTYRVATLKRMK